MYIAQPVQIILHTYTYAYVYIHVHVLPPFLLPTFLRTCPPASFSLAGEYDGAMVVFTRIYNETKGKEGQCVYVYLVVILR